MAQIQKGTTFSTGDQVTATNLNAHVDSAILLPGAISDQASDTAALTDTILVNKSGSLKKVTAASLAGLVDTTSFLRADGTIPLTTSAQLVLGSTQQLSALQATSKGYVDAADAVVNNTLIALVPSGAIMAFYRSTTPTGWLECNGATIANSGDTAALYALIGATLPDLRGEFIRGWDHGKGTDSGRTLGTSQAGAIEAHSHLIGRSAEVNVGSNFINASNSYRLGLDANLASTSSVGGTETRPRNVAFMYCIKK